MVEFDNFDIGHVFRSHTAHQHHEHSTNGKIGCDERGGVMLICSSLDCRLLLLCESRCSNHRGYLMCKCCQDAPIDNVWPREVDHHIGMQAFKCSREISLHEDTVLRRTRKFSCIRSARNVHRSDESQICIVDHSLEYRAPHASCSTVYQNLSQDNLLPKTICGYSSPENPRMSRNTTCMLIDSHQISRIYANCSRY